MNDIGSQRIKIKPSIMYHKNTVQSGAFFFYNTVMNTALISILEEKEYL